MNTVEQIIAAAARLDAAQLLKLRKKLDQLEQKKWEAELAATTTKMAKDRIGDEEIDRMIMRRRYEGRR